MLRKLQPPTGAAARFNDESLRIGRIKLPHGSEVYCLFNWGDSEEKIGFRLARTRNITDFWSGENLGQFSSEFAVERMPPRSARLFICV